MLKKRIKIVKKQRLELIKSMSLSQKTKNFLSGFLRIALSIGLLTYLFRIIDVQKTLNIIKDANFFYLAWSLAALFILYFLTLLRWHIVIKALGLSIPFKSVARCFSIGAFFNLFLPTSTGGDVVKTIGLFKDTDKKTTVIASVLLDRIFGFVAIVLVASVSFAFGYKLVYDPFLLVAILSLAFFAGIGILFLFHERLYSFACRIFNKLPKIQEKLMKLHYAIVLIKSKHKAIFTVVFISCIVQGILALTFYLTARGLHQEILFWHCLVFVPLVCIAAAFPSLGGLGTRDLGAVFLFSKIGIDAGTAASMSLLNFFFMVIIGLTGALFYVATLHPRWVQCPQQASSADTKES
ncbi:MAG: lysylphosphatidylglycerol synthase transmembrane domain-containing protein [Candidatus Aceula meridiana]|nr:lysylphosphatidylglycerol synthase transmembrane domain-containing protein [Candidatus Aceula meridiana]